MGGGILSPNEHLIFPFPLRIHTLRSLLALERICLPMMILLTTTRYRMSSARDYSFKKAIVTRGIYCQYLELPFMATTREFTCLKQ